MKDAGPFTEPIGDFTAPRKQTFCPALAQGLHVRALLNGSAFAQAWYRTSTSKGLTNTIEMALRGIAARLRHGSRRGTAAILLDPGTPVPAGR